MSENILQIQKDYLKKAWMRPIQQLEEAIPARYEDNGLRFQAFGEPCEVRQEEIILGGEPLHGAEGILIAIYSSLVTTEPVQLLPLKAFRQFPGGMGYQPAFAMNAEKILIPHVESIQKRREELIARFSGNPNKDVKRYDFSFTLYPLPKVPLYYLFNLPDEEFSASVTCLFSSNADRFLPVETLADTAEYTAKKIIELVTLLKA
jgi:hypothetical protein